MIDHVVRFTLPAAFSLLPPAMDAQAARALLLAIALQESRCCHRRQIGGPARGLWQFERGGGVRGVLTHHASKAHAHDAMRALQYHDVSMDTAFAAIEHNDTLAAVFARLLLWTLPEGLPSATEPGEGWRCYVRAWRPGKPHPDSWDRFYAEAWSLA